MNSAPQAPSTANSVPQMSAWRRAQELTRKAEEEAMMAEKKSQEAYIWYTCFLQHKQYLIVHMLNTHLQPPSLLS